MSSKDREKGLISKRESALDRREFLRQGATATFSAYALGVTSAGAAPEPPRIRRHKKLGKTGLEISDIGMGTGALRDPNLVRHAFERGITYFDTAESYPMNAPGQAEKALGIALAGKREQVVLASKVITNPRQKRGFFMRGLEGSLRRLRTDHIDIYFSHAVNDVARLKHAEWHEFTESAKKQGKIRFVGISGHGGRLSECLDYALDNDLVDVILAAHNFGQDPAFYEKFTKRFDLVANQPELPRLLDKAHKKGVGTIAMKTLRGARLNDMKPYEWGGATFAQAAFRWVLANPSLDALVVSMRSREAIDMYVAASGEAKVRGADLRLLRNYVALNEDTYCQHGCDVCESSCPHGVAISEVLRTRMYATDYEDLEMARGSYARLGAGATACLSCADQPCLSACPIGLEIPKLTRSMRQVLGSG